MFTFWTERREHIATNCQLCSSRIEQFVYITRTDAVTDLTDILKDSPPPPL
jgi:hypothetical protein